MRCFSLRAGRDMFKYGEKHSHAEESSGGPKSPERLFPNNFQLLCSLRLKLGQAAGEEDASK